MPGFLTIILILLAAYALYLAAQVARHTANASDHLDAGASLGNWVYIFVAAGVLAAGLGPFDHLRLVARYGFQADMLFLSLVCMGLAGALFQKRLWLASRILQATSPGDVFARYYQSPSIRIFMLGTTFLFAVPLASHFLSQAADLLVAASSGAIGRLASVFYVGIFTFIFAGLGGWRAVVYVSAALSVLMGLLMIFVCGFITAALGEIALFHDGLKVTQGVLADSIPGVIQFSSGLGRTSAEGGMWTALAIASFAVSAVGIAISPNFSFLGLTTRPSRGFAFSQVWVLAGLGAGLFICLAPFIAAELESAKPAAFQALFIKLSGLDDMAGAALVLMLLSALLLGLAYFAVSGANIFTKEVVNRYLLPGTSGTAIRLSSRIVLALTFALIVFISGFAPALGSAFAPLAAGISVQLFMAYLGLCWMPWLSRSAVLVGMCFGALVVFFTEAPGLILFDQLFVPLPWGRWPLTVHSAAWGLLVNVSFCLLIAIFNRKGAERAHRDQLHDIFARDHKTDFGGRGAQGAKWSLTLIWAFLAIGPGAVLGNTFFSKPYFSGADLKLGMPSLWVWEILFWVVGVFLVWWLAYRTELSIISTERLRPGELAEDPRLLTKARQPKWLRQLVDRLSSRPGQTVRAR
jgi:solute:Na+ symporter, SSS family